VASPSPPIIGLETVELVVAWEQALGISIPNEICGKLQTPELAAREISAILLAEGKDVPMSEICGIIKATTLEITGLPEETYAEHLRFVEDLGLD
jgi:hypothetical protein